MNTFVADENFDDKRVIRACRSEGRCHIRRYPRQLRKKKDYEVLPALMRGSATLVTLDATIVEENGDYIPEDNRGIVVIRLRRPSKTITTRIASTLLREFKSRFSAWADIRWDGLCLEIMETEIMVSRLDEWRSGTRVNVSYSSAEFDAEVAGAIREIAPAAIKGI